METISVALKYRDEVMRKVSQKPLVTMKVIIPASILQNIEMNRVQLQSLLLLLWALTQLLDPNWLFPYAM
jgi:hypothetical protein